MLKIAPTAARYIKLGAGNSWFDRCLAEGLVALGSHEIPHDVCVEQRWSEVQALFEANGRGPAKAKDFTRQLIDFYTLGEDCLWITFAHKRLWWGFAEADVEPRHESGFGRRVRRIIGGWRDTDIQGSPLEIDSLSTRLTQLAAYQQTLCGVRAMDYLVNRINRDKEPFIAAAERARDDLIAAAETMIPTLHWADFELMVDLIFAASGWRRVSEVGGSKQADTDLILEQAATGEKAFVQIKSKTSRKVFGDYVERFRRAETFDRMFFAYHSPVTAFTAPEIGRPTHVWDRTMLAEKTIQAGLFDWLLEKAR